MLPQQMLNKNIMKVNTAEAEVQELILDHKTEAAVWMGIETVPKLRGWSKK